MHSERVSSFPTIKLSISKEQMGEIQSNSISSTISYDGRRFYAREEVRDEEEEEENYNVEDIFSSFQRPVQDNTISTSKVRRWGILNNLEDDLEDDNETEWEEEDGQLEPPEQEGRIPDGQHQQVEDDDDDDDADHDGILYEDAQRFEIIDLSD